MCKNIGKYCLIFRKFVYIVNMYILVYKVHLLPPSSFSACGRIKVVHGIGQAQGFALKFIYRA